MSTGPQAPARFRRSRSRSSSLTSLSSRPASDASRATAIQTGHPRIQHDRRPPAARLFDGISFFVQPTRDPYFSSRVMHRIRDAGGIIHATPMHPAVTIIVVFPRPDSPTNMILNLKEPRMTFQALTNSGRWDLHSLVWHYAREVVNGRTRPERRASTLSGYKCTRVFSADWVDVVIQNGQCDIKNGNYLFPHREILLRSGVQQAYQPRAEPRPPPLSPPFRQAYKPSPTPSTLSLWERLDGPGSSAAEPRQVHEYNSGSSASRQPNFDRIAETAVPLRDRVAERKDLPPTGGIPGSAASTSDGRRPLPADSPLMPNKRPRLESSLQPDPLKEPTASAPQRASQEEPSNAPAVQPQLQEQAPDVEVKLEHIDTWIVCAGPLAGNFELKKVATVRPAKGNATAERKPQDAVDRSQPSANETNPKSGIRASTPDRYRMSTPVSTTSTMRPSVARSSPEVPLAELRRNTVLPRSTMPTPAPSTDGSGPPAPSASQAVNTKTGSAAPPTPVTAGAELSALGLQTSTLMPSAGRPSALAGMHGRTGALVGSYGLRNTFCTDYCGRGSVILNPFITLNGGLVTPATRAMFILLPLDPSQVAETENDRAILKAIDEAQAVLSDRYVADSIAAGGMLPIDDYKIRLDP